MTKPQEEDERAHMESTSRHAVEPLSTYSPSIIIDEKKEEEDVEQDVEKEAAKDEQNISQIHRERRTHTDVSSTSPIIDQSTILLLLLPCHSLMDHQIDRLLALTEPTKPHTCIAALLR